MNALTADLSVFSLASLLQAAESDQASGTFRFEPHGSLVLRNGRLVDATYGGLLGIDAALTLLMVTPTQLVFESSVVDERPPLIDMMALVIDGARLNDDWAALAPQVLAPRDDRALDRLHPTTSGVVRALDGQRIVHEAVEAAGVDVVTVIDDLIDLREAGALVEVGPPHPERLPQHDTEPSLPETADFDLLVDASRVALRDKAYDHALELLVRASSLRPDNRTILQNIRRLRQMSAHAP